MNDKDPCFEYSVLNLNTKTKICSTDRIRFQRGAVRSGSGFEKYNPNLRGPQNSNPNLKDRSKNSENDQSEPLEIAVWHKSNFLEILTIKSLLLVQLFSIIELLVVFPFIFPFSYFFSLVQS